MHALDMEIFDDERFWAWVEAHNNDDPAKLRLAWHGREPWIDDAVRQIECRRKYRRKLQYEISYDRFYFPISLSGEQSTGDELARIHAAMIPSGAHTIVDLTSGLGVDAMTIARATGVHVVAVERDSVVSAALRHNAGVVGADVETICADCRDYLESVPDGRFDIDIAFIDPARRDADGGRVFGIRDCEPDILTMLPLLRRKVRTLIVKLSPMLDVTRTLRDLPGTTDLWSLGSSTECKEIVACCDLQADISSDYEPDIHAVTPNGEISFRLGEEACAESKYGTPMAGGWLYEPWPAVMKVAPWRLLSSRYGMVQLHPNTHLYYSPGPVSDFPGEGRRILEVLPFASSVLKQLPRRYSRMQVAARNFPMAANVLSRKLRAKEGYGAPRLMAATVVPDTPVLIVLEGQ